MYIQMNKKTLAFLFLCYVVTHNNTSRYAWGVYGHQHITKAAILALPADMGMFFYDHADFLVEESVVPDLRKYTLGDKSEFPRHYINLESYNYTSAAMMPQTMKEALAIYNKDSMQIYGILPWYIQDMMDKLTNAMKNKSKTEIIFLAADLSHYIADAYMPLHTSINHDGQFTEQKGIHAFWESELPELFGDDYTYYTGDAHYIDNIRLATWGTIERSHILADTMLVIEKKLRKEFPEDKVYTKDADGKMLKNKFGQPVFSKEYATEYHNRLHGMVEAQMRAAIQMTANFWYTAWVNAGKPKLDDLDPTPLQDKYAEEMKEWKTGKLPGLKTSNEFK
jgi:hypothetical protein